MKFPKINTQSPIFIKLSTLFIVLFVIFIPKDSFKKLFSNGNSGIATVFTTSVGGDWSHPSTWGLNGGLISFQSAHDVTISPTGEIYVADSFNNRVVVLNPDGTASTTYNPGSEFKVPYAITLAPNGDIYVLDIDIFGDGNSRIIILNPDGTASTTYNIGMPYLQGIAVSSAGKIYTTDSSGSRIIAIEPGGIASTTYSVPANPVDVTVSPTGEIYVVGVNGTSLTILNSDGTASTTYGSGNYYGIAISPITQEIYVVDFPNIKIFNPNGTASTTWTGLGFNYPQGISISSITGDIYVADLNGGGIVLVNPNGTASTTFYGTLISPSFIGTPGVDYPGVSNNVTLSTGNIFLSADQSVHNITIANGATLDLAGYTLNVSGNWNNTGGTFLSNGGTVNFISTTSQSILGTNTFENLVKLASTTSSLLFDPTGTTTVTNNLFLSGIAGNLLTITSAFGSVSPIFSSKLGGSDRSGFYAPQKIIRSSNGEIYIVDNGNKRIVVLNPDGTASTSYSVAPAAPYGLAISPAGDIYITVIDSNSGLGSVLVLNPDGTASTTFGSGILNYPTDIIFSQTGEIYVANTNSGTPLFAFNADGTASTTFGPVSYIPYAFGVTIAPSHEFYISDTYSCRIIVLNPDGTASTTFNNSVCPITTNFRDTGEVYVLDSLNNQIVVLNPDGTASTTFSSLGLSAPNDMFISPIGEMYISDSNNNRIVILNPDGTASTTYTNTIPGSFGAPFGTVHDSQGNIYVSDQRLGNIQKFDSLGEFILSFDTAGPAALTLPGKLSVDSHNNIYVVDTNNTRIVKFDSDGNFLTSTTTTFSSIGQLAIDSQDNIYANLYSSTDNAGEIVKMDQGFNVIATTSNVNNVNLNPYGGLALDPTEQFIYFTDSNTYEIFKINTSDLSFVSSINTSNDIGNVNFTSIGIDPDGNLYLTVGNSTIVKYSSDLIFLAQFGSFGTDDGQFSSPTQVTINLNGLVYITDQNKGDVQIFTPSPFTSFHLVSTGSSTLNYLSVAGSIISGSEDSYRCTPFCRNGGSNTGWIFPHGFQTTYNQPTPTAPTPMLPPSLIQPIPETEVPSTPVVTEPTPTVTFTKNLKPGDTDPQVQLLQQFLNTHGYPIATTGAGSPGHESTYFGSLTKAALIKFQNDHAAEILTPLGLTEGTGYFYTVTREYVNSIL